MSRNRKPVHKRNKALGRRPTSSRRAEARKICERGYALSVALLERVVPGISKPRMNVTVPAAEAAPTASTTPEVVTADSIDKVDVPV